VKLFGNGASAERCRSFNKLVTYDPLRDSPKDGRRKLWTTQIDCGAGDKEIVRNLSGVGIIEFLG